MISKVPGNFNLLESEHVNQALENYDHSPNPALCVLQEKFY